MRSLLDRSLDIYQLKNFYKYLIALFFLGGLLAGFWPTLSWAYDAQAARGLTPGAPIGSEPGSIAFLILCLTLLLGGGLLGMALGALVLSLALTAFSNLTLRASLRAIFLSYYPENWFKRSVAA